MRPQTVSQYRLRLQTFHTQKNAVYRKKMFAVLFGNLNRILLFNYFSTNAYGSFYLWYYSELYFGKC